MLHEIWGEKEGYRIRAIQMESLRGLLGISRVDRVPNAQIRKMRGGTRGWMKGLTKVFSDG